jgi:hypothetical protein
MDSKLSNRRKYNPDGKNEYSVPKNKPPRHDLRRRHRIKDDPLDRKDKLKEDKIAENLDQENLDKSAEIEFESSSQLNPDITSSLNKEVETAKKIARQRIKNASERKTYHDTGYNVRREGLETYKFKETGMKAVAKTYKHLADAFLASTKAMATFTSCKSSEVSPDGKLGGQGYIKPVKEIRKSLAECINLMSELIDTFHDEVNSPYWKKTTVEDHPFVKEILDKADEIVDMAEDLDENNDKNKVDLSDPSKIVLSELEKQKIKALLEYKMNNK